VSIKRTRLDAERSRSLALDAASRLLIGKGPQSVTLKNVAAEIGQSHVNLLHHFGSAAGLQSELARSIAERVTARISTAVERARAGEADPSEIVDEAFDAFEREGAGALAAWMILSGNSDALDPVLTSIRDLVAGLASDDDDEEVAAITLSLVLTALGDSLLGRSVTSALGLPRETARRNFVERLRIRLASRSGHSL
jgi:AcrR family transcriptional regulator